MHSGGAATLCPVRRTRQVCLGVPGPPPLSRLLPVQASCYFTCKVSVRTLGPRLSGSRTGLNGRSSSARSYWKWVPRPARCGWEKAGRTRQGSPVRIPRGKASGNLACQGLQCLKPRWVSTEPWEPRPGAQSCLCYGFEMFLLLNVLSFFLPACLPFGPLAV